jgi:hypothetical protein
LIIDFGKTSNVNRFFTVLHKPPSTGEGISHKSNNIIIPEDKFTGRSYLDLEEISSATQKKIRELYGKFSTNTTISTLTDSLESNDKKLYNLLAFRK